MQHCKYKLNTPWFHDTMIAHWTSCGCLQQGSHRKSTRIYSYLTRPHRLASQPIPRKQFFMEAPFPQVTCLCQKKLRSTEALRLLSSDPVIQRKLLSFQAPRWCSLLVHVPTFTHRICSHLSTCKRIDILSKRSNSLLRVFSLETLIWDEGERG